MRDHRLLAVIAAVLITAGGVLTVTAGGSPSLPPPVTVRGSLPLAADDNEGLQMVPAPVVDLEPTTNATTDSPDQPTTPTGDTADMPDMHSPDVVDDASPDDGGETDTHSAASADSADSPDD